GVLPRGTRFAVSASADGVPGRRPELAVAGAVIAHFQHATGNAVLREVGDRVAAGLVQQNHVLAIGNPGPAEAHAHAPPQGLGVAQSIWQRIWNEEAADLSR